MADEIPRYAVYFAPDLRTPLWRFGCGVIGYDAAEGVDVPFSTTGERSSEEWVALTEEPRRYGFHATLKAPFYLAGATTEDEFLRRVKAFAAARLGVVLDGLRVSALSRFIALTPVGDVVALMALCEDVVESLDDLRAPLNEQDRARRLTSPLSGRQRDYLERFGYPFVREEFRFHMTLTGPVPLGAIEAIREHLDQLKLQERLDGPVTIDALTVFRQSTRNQRFRIIARFPLVSS